MKFRTNAFQWKAFLIFFGLLFVFGFYCNAQNVTGRVLNANGKPLSFASIYVKGSSKGTTANNDGYFFINLPVGNNTLVCAHIGYQKAERSFFIHQDPVVVEFKLALQLTELKGVEIRSNAEDPAYEIMRNAIKLRQTHLEEIKEWQALVYMKGMIRTFAVPQKIFGMELPKNEDLIDSNGRGILYFSESLTRFSRRLPHNYHEEVISAKVSGRSQSFGFNNPRDMEINLYKSNIEIEGISKRGIISPLHNNAFYFYKFIFEGVFYEDGLEINKIKVIPRRKYEPCFAGGYINIIEGSFRIHSFDVNLNRKSQIEVADSIRIVQQLFPLKNGIWFPHNTFTEAKFSMLGIIAGATFNAIYSDYVFDADFDQIFENRIVKVIDTSANKKTIQYWDSLRPTPLTAEERLDYLKKDTLETKLKDPSYLDSVYRKQNRLTIAKFFLLGTTINRRKSKMRYSFPSVAQALQYNTVEGWLVNLSPTIQYYGDTGAFKMKPQLRYGFKSQHFKAAINLYKSVGNKPKNRWDLRAAIGKYVFQLNPSNPIDPVLNSVSTLFFGNNFMKIYEKSYGEFLAHHNFNNGFEVTGGLSYEDRMPLQNSDTSFSIIKNKKWRFTNNYPEELLPGYFFPHQAFLSSIQIKFQPGQKFVQYPERLVSLGSNMPVFTLEVTKAWRNVFGSDAKFGKWKLDISDVFKMKLAGTAQYRATVGGFYNNASVQLPDWQHFNGNLTKLAREYVNTFQLAPYYANSTSDKFFVTANVEWHFNGILTNKIPLVRRFNLGLVAGFNGFYVDNNRNYNEVFIGLENIFKVLRIDYVWGYDGFNRRPTSSILIGIGGIFSGGQ